MKPVRRPHPRLTIGCMLLTIAIGGGLLVPGAAARQAKVYLLESADGLRLNNVAAEPAVLDGRKGVRVTLSAEARRRMEDKTASAQMPVEQLASIVGLDFANGVIEAEIAGAPAPDAGEGARGFVGIAFRLQNDMRTYDAFLSASHQRSCGRSGATQSCRAVHLAPRRAMVQAPQGNPVPV